MNKGNLKPEVKKAASPGKQPASSNLEKKTRDNDDFRLPVLVEFAYTASALLVILASLMVVVVSFVMGASLLDIVIRTAVTILVIGGLLTLVSWQVSAGALQASLAEQQEEIDKAKELLEKMEHQEPEEPIPGSALEAL